ncbi:MAG: prepilin-type N-terminal cleavage/methylation domain-containing protein, partial [Phycisphaerae bacterium]|nr:prepilin-type N-terminal cleavage/methylation domain-containing protein [Phycisphaerae bacterium]NIU07551.1 prepilin-type N-terminal cleavage/methylation domain-containing protein [Phycisphaerae bacterium]NIW46278.1 prepilin-type N-terminal cleavage/methylation domain-containing protein [Gammaproteobacteria bacterium]NIW97003.1 prepilin-type N-terminal cleavage/methylation domain-containing protein [Phycisphaerae bacterium]
MIANIKNKEQGFTLVEAMVVVAIIAIIIGLAGGFSVKAGFRRNVDSATQRVSNTLQLTKLQAARNGVEFRTVFV